MTEFFYDSYKLLCKAILLGVILGAIYDIFKMIRIAKKSDNIPCGAFFKKIYPKKTIFGSDKHSEKEADKTADTIFTVFEDILYFIISALFEILFFLGENDGEIRIYCIVFIVIGFLVYEKTIGKIVAFFSSRIIFLVRCLLYWVIYIIIFPIRTLFELVKKAFMQIYLMTDRKIILSIKRRYSNDIEKELIRAAADGFGIFKEVTDEKKK